MKLFLKQYYHYYSMLFVSFYASLKTFSAEPLGEEKHGEKYAGINHQNQLAAPKL